MVRRAGLMSLAADAIGVEDRDHDGGLVQQRIDRTDQSQHKEDRAAALGDLHSL